MFHKCCLFSVISLTVVLTGVRSSSGCVFRLTIQLPGGLRLVGDGVLSRLVSSELVSSGYSSSNTESRYVNRLLPPGKTENL